VTRLQKFVEQGAFGEKSGRVAYGFRLDLLPEASDGMSWRKIESFSAGDELLTNAGLKEVFKTAIERGCALVTNPAEPRK
jgi:hypothetical protein